MKRIVLFLSLLFPSLLFAQGGSVNGGGILVLAATGKPIGNATVTICSFGSTGIPCVNTITVYTDPTLSITASNPATTDGNGNLFRYASPGVYTYTVTGTGIIGASYTATVSGSGGGNAVTGGPNTFTALNTFSNTTTFSGLIQCKNFENVQCADSTFPHGGSDMGDEINKAYAACPSNGCEIDIFPSSTGACYNFTIPIVLTTASKVVLLRGLGSESQVGTTSNGTCLNYTPTTATTAITMDYEPSGGGGGTRNHGIYGLRIINNQCNTPGGCGSSATGVSLTSVNAGGQNAAWERFSVVGFGTGIKINSGSSSQVSWGMSFWAGACSYNTTCLSIANGIEMTKFYDVMVIGNATGISMGTSSDFLMVGGHCDSNTVICFTSTGGTFTSVGVHYENLGINNMNMVNAGLSAHIHGGFALDDCASSGACGGVTPAYWFQAPSLEVTGQDIFTGGRLPTHVYVGSSNAVVTGIVNPSNIFPLANIISVTSGNVIFSQMNGGITALHGALFEADSGAGATFTCGQVGGITGWGSTGACSNPQGGMQRFQFTMTAGGTGITVNPVVTITFAIPWPIAPLYQCKMVGGTAALGFVTGENNISANTLGPLGYIGTPTAGQTVIFGCTGI